MMWVHCHAYCSQPFFYLRNCSLCIHASCVGSRAPILFILVRSMWHVHNCGSSLLKTVNMFIHSACLSWSKEREKLSNFTERFPAWAVDSREQKTLMLIQLRQMCKVSGRLKTWCSKILCSVVDIKWIERPLMSIFKLEPHRYLIYGVNTDIRKVNDSYQNEYYVLYLS